MDSELELLTKRIELLEQKIEIYFQILNIRNEIDFILKGTYILDEDIEEVLDGTY